MTISPVEMDDAELIATLAAALDDEPGLAHALAVMCSTFDIRVLTVRYPWSALIAAGVKDVENRTAKVNYRGPVLIQSSIGKPLIDSIPGDENGESYDIPDLLRERGVVLALTTLTDCHEAEPGCCASRWAEPAAWHWVLSGTRALPEPIPAKGKLGLWRPDRDLIVRALRQLRESADV